MENEEIIKRELFGVVSELKANQNLHNDIADASIAEMAVFIVATSL